MQLAMAKTLLPPRPLAQLKNELAHSRNAPDKAAVEVLSAAAAFMSSTASRTRSAPKKTTTFTLHDKQTKREYSLFKEPRRR
jgi:hypothetical protein